MSPLVLVALPTIQLFRHRLLLKVSRDIWIRVYYLPVYDKAARLIGDGSPAEGVRNALAFSVWSGASDSPSYCGSDCLKLVGGC